MTKPLPSIPIKVGDGLLIYERRACLEVVATMTTMDGHATISRKIPWDMLIESAKRCRPEVFRK